MLHRLTTEAKTSCLRCNGHVGNDLWIIEPNIVMEIDLWSWLNKLLQFSSGCVSQVNDIWIGFLMFYCFLFCIVVVIEQGHFSGKLWVTILKKKNLFHNWYLKGLLSVTSINIWICLWVRDLMNKCSDFLHIRWLLKQFA